jgi:polyhydroxyalkanoate synthase
VATRHAAALLRFQPHKTTTQKSETKKRPALILIPSLINRFHILDLHPKQSFARFLYDAGYDVFLLDWHADLSQKLPATLEQAVTDYIIPLCDKIPHTHYHMIGYCMGGTLAIAAAQLNPKPVTSLTLIATPWDFHQPDAALGKNLSAYIKQAQKNTPQLNPMFKGSWLQMLFWRNDPLTALRKFTRFAAQKPDSHEAHLFTLTEDWLNDGVDLPLSLLADCAETWYAQNAPHTKQWRIGNILISPHKLTKIPLHLITAARDGLVPPQSSLPLTEHKNAQHDHFDTGHIGLFAGAKSVNTIWPQVQHSLSGHNTR